MANGESLVEKYLIKRIIQLGGQCHKWTGTRFCPDRIVILPSGKVWFVEVKTFEGKLSIGQKRFISRLINLNTNVVTLYGIKDVVSWLDKHVIGGKNATS